jgi:hypothetical protein
MCNNIYRYKQLAVRINKRFIKAWSKPISLIRKKGDLTCEGCYFWNNQPNQTINRCEIMLKSGQLPTCAPHFIFKRVLKTEYEKRIEIRRHEKLKEKLNKDKTQELKIA